MSNEPRLIVQIARDSEVDRRLAASQPGAVVGGDAVVERARLTRRAISNRRGRATVLEAADRAAPPVILRTMPDA
jgi:hypothetical protein